MEKCELCKRELLEGETLMQLSVADTETPKACPECWQRGLDKAGGPPFFPEATELAREIDIMDKQIADKATELSALRQVRKEKDLELIRLMNPENTPLFDGADGSDAE